MYTPRDFSEAMQSTLGFELELLKCAEALSFGLLGFSSDPVIEDCPAVCLTCLWAGVAKVPLPVCGAEF